ncbi:MAG TPA: hypothetical protein VM778_07955, partial [Gemmatimonadota bacterium]|nr:hypothetical protein [Gemmatimonadota bacterium]
RRGPERPGPPRAGPGGVDGELAAMPAGAATEGWEVEPVDAAAGRRISTIFIVEVAPAPRRG